MRRKTKKSDDPHQVKTIVTSGTVGLKSYGLSYSLGNGCYRLKRLKGNRH